jgi:hypothetical protein
VTMRKGRVVLTTAVARRRLWLYCATAVIVRRYWGTLASRLWSAKNAKWDHEVLLPWTVNRDRLQRHSSGQSTSCYETMNWNTN